MYNLLLDQFDPRSLSSSITGSRYEFPFAFSTDKGGCGTTNRYQRVDALLTHVIRPNSCSVPPRPLISWSQKRLLLPTVEGAPNVMSSETFPSAIRSMLATFDFAQIVDYLGTALQGKVISRNSYMVTQSIDSVLDVRHVFAIPKFRDVKDFCGDVVGRAVTISVTSQKYNLAQCRYIGEPSSYTTSVSMLLNPFLLGLDTVEKRDQALLATGWDDVAELYGKSVEDGPHANVGPQLDVEYVIGVPEEVPG